MDKKDLLKMIADDPLDLLKLDPEKPAKQTENDRLVASFEEINQFVSQHGHEPQANGDMQERKLCARLDGIRQNKVKAQTLKKLDSHGLLNQDAKEFNTIDDVFADDNFGILDDEVDIFDISHVPVAKSTPDYIATRKPCENFNSFQNLFVQCQADIAAGKRKLVPFRREQTIDERHFYVLKGVLVYVADIGEGKNHGSRSNPRLRCIFENGTESDLLLHSLAAALYKDGRRVTDYHDQSQKLSAEISSDDEESGYIYILQSLSTDPKITKLKDLYKIGFSTIAVEERVKNATVEPTYLMAQVSVIAIYQCYNLNTQKFEQLLHTFFASSCLNIDIFDSKGQRHCPREWFIAPLNIIEQAIELLISGKIIDFRYDADTQTIVCRE